MRSGESCGSKTIFIRPNCYSLCYFEPRYISLSVKPLSLTNFRMYQMHLSSQSSVLTIMLNQAIYQRALNPYQQPISKNATTTLICHHQGLYLCNLIYLIVVYFTFIYFISNLINFINSVLKLY